MPVWRGLQYERWGLEWRPLLAVPSRTSAARSLAMRRYSWRSSAEFAKAAMHQQRLLGSSMSEVLDVRWAVSWAWGAPGRLVSGLPASPTCTARSLLLQRFNGTCASEQCPCLKRCVSPACRMMTQTRAPWCG